MLEKKTSIIRTLNQYLPLKLVLLAALTISVISCKKKNSTEENIHTTPNLIHISDIFAPADSFDIGYLTSAISEGSQIHPYLIFTSRTSFDYTKDQLKRLNDAFIIPINLEDSLDEDPILWKFESNFSNYMSLRRKIFDEIDSLSSNNNFDPSIYDPDDNFIEDTYLRTVLNDLYEVQIGERIYKVMSEDWVADFPANIEEDLSFIRSFNINSLNDKFEDTLIGDINFQYTGQVFLTEELNGSTSKRSGCSAGIQIKYDNDGLVHFIGFPQDCTLFWDFGDGSTGSGIIPDHKYSKNGTYLVTVNASCGIATCDASKEVIITSASSSNPCNNPPVSSFVSSQPDLGQLLLISNLQDNSLTYLWENKTTNISEIGKGSWKFDHYYPNSRSYRICLTIYGNNGCKSNVYCDTMTIQESCCQKGNKMVSDNFEFIPDHRIKYKLVRWNGGFLGNYISAKTIHYEKRFRKFRLRKNPSKHWIKTKSQIYVKFEGDIWVATRKQVNYPGSYGEPCRRKFYISEEEYKGNKHIAECRENPMSPDFGAKIIYTKRRKLKSTHWILINGQYYTRELYLTACP